MHSPVIEPLEARIAPATLAISPVTLSQNETDGNTTFHFLVTLADDATRNAPITVAFTTNDGTSANSQLNAIHGTDYDTASGTLTFPVGTTTQDISVTVHGNTTAQPNRTFTVDLTNAAEPGGNGMVTISGATSTATILDDDQASTA